MLFAYASGNEAHPIKGEENFKESAGVKVSGYGVKKKRLNSENPT